MEKFPCRIDPGYAGIIQGRERSPPEDSSSEGSGDEGCVVPSPFPIRSIDQGAEDDILNMERCLDQMKACYESFENCVSLDTSKKFYRLSSSFRNALKEYRETGIGRGNLNLMYTKFSGLMTAQMIMENEGVESFFAEMPDTWRYITNQMMGLILNRKDELEREESSFSGPSVFDAEIKEKMNVLSEAAAKKEIKKWKDAAGFAEQLRDASKVSEERYRAENEHLRGEAESIRREIRTKVKEKAELDCKMERQKKLSQTMSEEQERQKIFYDELERQNRAYRGQLESSERSMREFLLQLRMYEREVEELKTDLRIAKISRDEDPEKRDESERPGRKARKYQVNYIYPSADTMKGIPSNSEIELFLDSKIPGVQAYKAKIPEEHYHGMVAEFLIKLAALEFHCARGVLSGERFRGTMEVQRKSGIWAPDAFGKFYKVVYDNVEQLLGKEYLFDPPEANPSLHFKIAERTEDALRNKFRRQASQIDQGQGASGKKDPEDVMTDWIKKRKEEESRMEAARKSRKELPAEKREFVPDI